MGSVGRPRCPGGSLGRFTAPISDPWTLAGVPQGGIVAAVAAWPWPPRSMCRTDRRSSGVRGRPAAGSRRRHRVASGRSRSQLGQCTTPGGGRAHGGGRARRTAAVAFTDLTFPRFLVKGCARSAPIPEGVTSSSRSPLPSGSRSSRHGRRSVDPRGELRGWPGRGRGLVPPDDPPVVDDGYLDPLATSSCATCPTPWPRRSGPTRSGSVPAQTSIHVLDRAFRWLLGLSGAAPATVSSVEMALRDPSGPTLVAYATQMMFFAFGL